MCFKTDLPGPDKGQFRLAFPPSAQLRLSDNDFSGCPQPTPTSSQRNTSGRAGWNGCARLLRCGRDRSGGGFPNAGYEPHPSAIERYTNEVKRLARVLNHRLEEVPWLAGDEYSMADIITFPWIHRRADGRAFCRARQHRSRRLPGRQTLVRRDDGTSGGPARPRGAGRATARSVDQ